MDLVSYIDDWRRCGLDDATIRVRIRILFGTDYEEIDDAFLVADAHDKRVLDIS